MRVMDGLLYHYLVPVSSATSKIVNWVLQPLESLRI